MFPYAIQIYGSVSKVECGLFFFPNVLLVLQDKVHNFCAAKTETN